MATIGDYQWNFYEWNRIKSSYPQLTKKKTTGGGGGGGGSMLCVIL